MIYCLEDDDSIRELMLYTLAASGFEVRGFPDSEPFWAAVGEQVPELILLDIMLPGEDGISVLKALRSRPATAELPVIMATAKGTEYDKVIGLDLGADDYLAKPFGMMEMVSRVRAVLRRSARRAPEQVLRLGGVELDKGACLVRTEGRRIELTRKEYQLLLLFLENPGRVFTRETRTVDVHIGTLRTKLGQWGRLIATVRGMGYRLEDAL